MTLETYVLDQIEGKRHSAIAKAFLWGASQLFRAGISLRNRAYDKKWFKAVKVATPVVSIGNIVAGGTGKTPLIHLLAEELAKKGKVAILSRGYLSEIEHKITKLSALPELNSEVHGDEPTWLQRTLPEVDVWVGKNRVASAKKASSETKVLLLDDGMQFRSLERDVEIVVMDAEDLFGKGHFLPRGLLRDAPRRLKGADLIVLNHIKDKAHFEKCEKAIRPLTEAPVVGMRYKIKNRESLSGKGAGVFCGIGKPQRFLDMLVQSGIAIVDAFQALDHHDFSSRQLEAFALRCKQRGAHFLACTEKDAVKLAPDLKTSLPIQPIHVEIEFVEGKEKWDGCIKKIKEKMAKS